MKFRRPTMPTAAPIRTTSRGSRADLKTADEIENMRAAGRLARLVITETSKRLAPGVTTGELEDFAVRILTEAGGTSPCLGYAPGTHPPYPAYTCISVNDEIVHAIPGRRVIKAGDLVTLDVCAELNGWLADTASTFPIGPVSPQAEKLLRVTRECLEKALAIARPGATTGDIGYTVQRHAESNGFSVVRELTGHGVGRTMHEGDLQIANHGVRGKGIVLQPGMTFAIEPMIAAGRKDIKNLSDGWTIATADGSLSAHFEHTIAITATGNTILTNGE